MEKTLHYLIMANHLLFQKSLIVNIKDTDLTLGQPKVLDYLLYHDGVVQKEIAGACHIEPATITSVLLGMENKGLITRKNLNGNRRSLYVYLTDEGKILAKRIGIEFESIEDNALKGFTNEEKKMLTDFLIRVNQNMKKEGEVCDE
ncbi:MAG: MarR family transcriptional regulator [Firmicutes bacterium]|nr:MarR family transcriptional regulator [Lachnospiraceae bacterium]MDD6065460.1 MarR family transcriptional regulator [Bacillota bacterium]